MRSGGRFRASRGVIGQFFPWVIKSETLHYGYAVVMLIGLFLLRKGFTGRRSAAGGRSPW